MTEKPVVTLNAPREQFPHGLQLSQRTNPELANLCREAAANHTID
jgi:hypothetical protein